MNRGRVSVSALVAIAFVVGLIGVAAGAALVWVAIGRPAAGRAGGAPSASREWQDAIVAAVTKVGPSVVNINTLVERRLSPEERALREARGMPTQPFPQQGQASGVIFDGQRGYVLTNTHVVSNAAQVEVLLADGRRFPAKVVGSDPVSEVAVVRISGDKLPTASLGSADSLPIGSWVIAIGNPFGFENSVTVGVISAKDRQIRGPNGTVLRGLIQTDASINPGNSGGALVDLDGDVVGIPTAIIPFAQGMGFAASIEVAKRVSQQIIATGKMSWPWLGIRHRPLPTQEVAKLHVPEGKGEIVASVVEGGPAARAGIKAGDVVLRVADQAITTSQDITAAVRSHNVGDRVKVVVWRDGRQLTLEATLAELPQEQP
jgi:serine protease Do